DLAFANAGNRRPARMAMIAMTTSSSIRVKADRALYAFSVALFSSPSPPLREERAGERRLHRRVMFGLPPPRPSPPSSPAGRGRHSSNTLNAYRAVRPVRFPSRLERIFIRALKESVVQVLG